jgi:hypothetical protein
MAPVKSLARTVCILAVLLVLLGTAIDGAEGSQSAGPKMLLQVTGDSVSADIKGAPLAEVARALERKIGARIHFSAPWMKRQVVNARFEGLTPEAALQAILEGSSYALVAHSASGWDGMQIYLCATPPPNATDRDVALRETRVEASESDLEPQTASRPERDPPAPPDAVDPDPAVRTLELQGAVASYGQQSLPLVLAGIQDTDAAVRSAAERLLLDDLRDLVPKEILSRMALSSEHAEVRLQALEMMATERKDLEYTRITLDSALRDADPGVRQRAAELLGQLSEPNP